jgi:3D (Asp-Asp-Asp) domain-containing protein/LysM repeat protein
MRKFLLSTVFIAGSLLAFTPVSAAEYEVEKGDTLWDIAEQNQTTVAKLREMNNLETDTIVPTQLITIDKEITYVVKKGDSLSEIAVAHGVTVDDIKEWNNLETNLIIIGEKLTLKEVDKEATENQKATTKEETVETPEASNPVQAATVKTDATPKQEEPEKETEGKQTITVSATAYTAKCEGCSGITATGVNLLENPNMKVIAVDPSVIPLGSRVYVEGYGEAIAADTGGAIKGNKIDIHVPTKEDAYNWGRKEVAVTILD